MGYVIDNGAIISEAYELATIAIGINERNEYAHWILGPIQLARGQHDMAIADLERAIELNPNCSLAYGSLGTVLSFSGKFDESIKNNEFAIRLNPMDPSIFFRYSGIAMAHFLAGRHSEAVLWALRSIHRKPTWRIGHAVLASALAQQNKLEEAKVAIDNFLGINPEAMISDFQQLPFKNQDDAQQFEEGLRNAGLPK